MLERKGALHRLPGKARGLVLARPSRLPVEAFTPVPIRGTIPAGYPADVSQHALGFLPVNANSSGSPPGKMIFGLRVRGNSMIGANIIDGDHAFCQSSECRTPHPGEIVAALIDGEVSLKRYLLLGNSPCLKAENPAYPDLIPARELVIQGCISPSCEASTVELVRTESLLHDVSLPRL